MNGWDAMLQWLSLNELTNWQMAKAASQRLSAVYDTGQDDPPRDHGIRWIYPLIDLGHAEFDQSQSTVRATPPGISWSTLRNSGVLYGAWAADRLRSVNSAAVLHESAPGNGPTVRSVSLQSATEVQQLTDDLKVWLSTDTGERLLQELPTVNQMLVNLSDYSGSLDGRWQQVSYTEGRSRWHECDQGPVCPGIYRRLSGGIRRVLVSEDGRRFELPTPDHLRVALWNAAPPKAWRYRSAERILEIPTGLPPLPLHVSRGLTSASGCGPVRVNDRGGWWQYFHVSDWCAKHAARAMRRELRSSQQQVTTATFP